MSARPLDALSFPLSGMRLIEASAGTGKTYTIANLYLRLLLGIGRGQPLTVDQILVVTFTTAATEELRERVRRRIVDALEAFTAGNSADEFITRLIACHADVAAARTLLDAARRQMDEAAIYTIHSFCHRVLADNAFESGMAFDLEMVIDETVLRQRAAEDFWRQQIAVLGPDPVALLPRGWTSPAELLRAVAPFLGSQELLLEPESSWQATDGQVLRGKVEELKRLWIEEGVSDLLQQTPFLKSRKPGDPERIEAMERFCQSDALEFIAPRGESWELWVPDSIRGAMSKADKDQAPEHRAFDLCRELAEAFADAREALRIDLLRRGIEDIGKALLQAKLELNQLSPDDLLTGLDSALASAASGRRLAQAVADRYPVVMVDEFQDTDSVQYRIFASIYAGRPACGWIMIGDPKQAIYKFRGADVFAYIDARRRVEKQGEGLFTLDTNWRSSSAMVAAVNALFEYAEEKSAESGAFMYAGDIPFQPVKASAAADDRSLLVDGDPPTPLTFWYCRGKGKKGQLSNGRARELLAQKAASEIADLLSASTAGRVTLGGEALAPGNIAVLVRDRLEAAEVKAALSERGVNSVFLSRQSVFDASVAADLYHLLRAVVHPGNERKLRSALATPLLGVSLLDIAALEDDQAALLELLDEFAGYHVHFLRHGVLSMLRQVMARRNIPARLLAAPDGQRGLTDLRHLGELLQQASETTAGMHDLLRWYLRHLNGEGRGGGDNQRIRLESDSKLVQIVTIHASKGLEFDTVFVPLASVARQSANCIYHREEGAGFVTVADLAAGEDAVKATGYERLAEDMRLLYVAMTRARHRCYVGLGNIAGRKPVLPFAASAMAHLLGLGAVAEDEESLLEGLECAAAAIGTELLSLEVFAAEDVCEPRQVRWPVAAKAQLELPEPPVLSRDDWSLTSYTALARGVSRPGPLGGASDEQESNTVTVLVQDSERRTAFSFPRGARYGSLLHNILEHVPFDCDRHVLAVAVERELTNFGLDVDDWSEVVTDWMGQVLDCPLPPVDGLALRQLADSDRVSEMEFNFAIGETVSSQRLDRLLRSYAYLEGSAPLSFADVTGVMRGFIDLVFQRGGHYYLLDYKSNYLGPDGACYDREAMALAITGHRYDLQYLIYCLALHRYLALRVPDYNYEQHFGGVYYLFLRGMGQGDAATACGVFYDKPDMQLVEALDAVFGGGSDW